MGPNPVIFIRQFARALKAKHNIISPEEELVEVPFLLGIGLEAGNRTCVPRSPS